MKLKLLEDGVLDYKGNVRTYAVPNAIPAGSINADIKPAPVRKPLSKVEELKEHLLTCPVCSAGEKLCKFAEILVNSI